MLEPPGERATIKVARRQSALDLGCGSAFRIPWQRYSTPRNLGLLEASNIALAPRSQTSEAAEGRLATHARPGIPGFDLAFVNSNGNLRLNSVVYFLSIALSGHHVALERFDSFHVRVWFHDLDLGTLETEPDVDSSLFELPFPRGSKKQKGKAA